MEFLMVCGGIAITLFGAKSPFFDTRFHFLAVMISTVGAILFLGTIIWAIEKADSPHHFNYSLTCGSLLVFMVS